MLAFEATAPESVAELNFARPEADLSAEVRGRVALGDAPPRLDAGVSWRARRGRPPELALDLSGGWAVGDVRKADDGSPARWHSEPRKGGTRLIIQAPAFAEPAGTLALVVTATGSEGPGPFALPRLRPVGAAVVDETWTALAAPGLAVRPSRARGLAWADPASLSPSPDPDPKLEPALGWRWNAPEGEAWADLDRDAPPPAATIHETAALADGRLRVEVRLAIGAEDRRPRLLPVWFGEESGPPPSWRLQAGKDSMSLPFRLLDDGEKAGRGLPAGGSAWEVDLCAAPRGPVVLRADLERAWAGRGTIPLPALPARFHAGGVVRVAIDPTLRSEAEAAGLRVLDPDQAGPAPAGMRVAHAFRLEGPGGRLALRTEALAPSTSGGLIREATLSTHLGAEGEARQRLLLRVEPAGTATLGVTLPGGVSPELTLLDGKATTPERRGKALVFALPTPRPGRSSCTIALAYPAPTGAGDRPEAPAFTMPCLALAWDVSRPGPWAAEAVGPALVRADPEPSPSWPTARGRRLAEVVAGPRPFGLNLASDGGPRRPRRGGARREGPPARPVHPLGCGQAARRHRPPGARRSRARPRHRRDDRGRSHREGDPGIARPGGGARRGDAAHHHGRRGPRTRRRARGRRRPGQGDPLGRLDGLRPLRPLPIRLALAERARPDRRPGRREHSPATVRGPRLADVGDGDRRGRPADEGGVVVGAGPRRPDRGPGDPTGGRRSSARRGCRRPGWRRWSSRRVPSPSPRRSPRVRPSACWRSRPTGSGGRPVPDRAPRRPSLPRSPDRVPG